MNQQHMQQHSQQPAPHPDQIPREQMATPMHQMYM